MLTPMRATLLRRVMSVTGAVFLLQGSQLCLLAHDCTYACLCLQACKSMHLLVPACAAVPVFACLC